MQLHDVFRVDLGSLAGHLARWMARLASGGVAKVETKGLVDTGPLAALLARALPRLSGGEIAGIAENVAHCSPRAVALTTLDYRTGQTVTWLQGCGISLWERPRYHSSFPPSASVTPGMAMAGSASQRRSPPPFTAARSGSSRSPRAIARPSPSPDLLSLLLFEPSYRRRLIEIGEADADARFDEIVEVVRPRSP